MNSKKVISNYSRIKTGFNTKFVKYTERYKSKYNNDNIKLWWINLIAPIKNHILYRIIIDKTIDISITGFIISIILFSFGIALCLLKGIGIAVALALWQHYTKWYFRTRDKPWK